MLHPQKNLLDSMTRRIASALAFALLFLSPMIAQAQTQTQPEPLRCGLLCWIIIIIIIIVIIIIIYRFMKKRG